MSRLALPHRAADGLAFAGCVAAMLAELTLAPKAEATGWAVLAIVLVSLPVLTSRHRPTASLLAAVGLVLATMWMNAVYDTVGLPTVFCAYALARERGPRAALVSAAIALPMVEVILQVYSPHGLFAWFSLRNLALVVVPLALGVAAHDRRATTAALVQRAESAERSREEEALRRVGEERLRIARDVHDLVAHAMVAINVQAGVGAHLAEREPAQARETLRDIKRVSGEALADLRSLLGLLRQDDGDAAPVLPTPRLDGIGDLREPFGAAGIDLDISIDPAAEPLPAPVGAAGYRIVQEALTNVLKHAGPTTARVLVTRDRQCLRIAVEDDGGTGPTLLGRTGSGNGLRGMGERAAAVGGSVEAGPRDGGGWRVLVRLPLDTTPAA